MCYKRLLIIPAIWIAAVCALSAQRRTVPPKLEDLPRVAVDTLDTAESNVKVILYTNNTWSYYYPDIDERLSHNAFSKNWVTDHVFAYKDVELKDIPSVVEFDLISAMSDFHAPIVGKMSSKYGPRRRRNHNGVDIPLKVGEPIYATFSGKVRYSQYNTGGFGNLVIIRHENGLETWYAHLVRANVEVDDYVTAGAVIGYGGNTGRSRGAHLHFEVRYCDQTFDPEHIIDFTTGDIRYKTFVLNKSYLNIHSRASDTLEEDYDFEDTVLAVAAEGELSSEEILDNIAAYSGGSVGTGSSDPLYHTVRKGDSLYKIASLYGTTVKNICGLNGITEKTTIYPGRKLRVR